MAPDDGDGHAPAGTRATVWIYAMAGTLCSLAFGYDVGVVSGSLTDIQHTLNLTDFKKEAATSGLNFAAAVGSLTISGPALDLLGRRNTIATAALLLVAGAATVSTAKSFGWLLAGRALQGLGSGITISATSVYLAELAPDAARGAMVAMADVAINLGILLGYVIDYWVRSAWADQPTLSWRVAMALSGVGPVLFLVAAACFLPETPQFLVLQGRIAEARIVLQRTVSPAAVPVVMARLRRAAGEPGGFERRGLLSAGQDDGGEADAEDVTGGQPGKGARVSSWSDVLCPRAATVCRLCWVAIGLGFMQQCTGTEAILYYTSSIFSGEGMSSKVQFFANLGIGGCKFVGELVCMALVERTGRRALLIGGNVLLCLGVAAMTASVYLDGPDAAKIVCLSFIMFAFSIGAGPLTLVVANEIVPMQLRGKVVAASMFVNRITSASVALTFITLQHAMGTAAVFLLYTGLAVVATCFYWATIPELTGKALEAAAGS